MSKFKYIFLALLLLSPSVYANVVSLTSNYVAGQSDVVSKLNDDRIALTNGVNNIEGATASSTVQSYGQVKADTISEENMADDANPRIRTDEGAFCEDLVVSGFLPSTTSGTLTGSIPAGIAYPDGYRIEKTTATAKTFTANKDTYVYLETNGTLAYYEDTSDPGEKVNSARLCKVVTDGTEITEVVDQRTTNCFSGPFDIIKDDSTGSSLKNMLELGQPVRRFSPAGRSVDGWAQGLYVSYDGVYPKRFYVTKGSAYINGEFRHVSDDMIITQSADDPANGVGGIDGAIAEKTKYYVYAVADQANTASMSVTYTATNPETGGPSGVTNYRLIGMVRTSGGNTFVSSDMVTSHAIDSSELVESWVVLVGKDNPRLINYRNVSGFTDHGTGDYTITWDYDFVSGDRCAVVCTGQTGTGGTSDPIICSVKGAIDNPKAGSVRFYLENHDGTNVDTNILSVIAVGELR